MDVIQVLSESFLHRTNQKADPIQFHNYRLTSASHSPTSSHEFCVFQELVVGFHVLSPNAGEITQGFAIGMKLGAKKSDFDDLVGIHPTTAEVFTTLNILKSRGDKPPETTGC